MVDRNGRAFNDLRAVLNLVSGVSGVLFFVLQTMTSQLGNQ